MRAVVAMEDKPTGEVPELMDEVNALIGSQPYDILEAVHLTGQPLAPLDAGNHEPAKVDVDRVAPTSRFVHQHPFLVRIEGRAGVIAIGIKLALVDREVAALAIELEDARSHRWGEVGGVLWGAQHRGDDAVIGLLTRHVERHQLEQLGPVRLDEQVDQNQPGTDRVAREVDHDLVALRWHDVHAVGLLRSAQETLTIADQDELLIE